MNVHSTAVIHSASRIDSTVIIGPYAVIEDGVEIGAGTVIREHAVIRCGSVIGAGCQIDCGVVIGGLPQDTSFHPATPSGVRIGDRVTIREGVTINRATHEATFTSVGDDVFLMANCHVAHDCQLADKVILANGVLLGGHVQIGEATFIGGNAAVHQFVRIGESAMIGGLARVSMDMPPFCMMAERNDLVGLNLVGLRRRGFSREEIRELKRLYHLLFSVAGRPHVLAAGLQADGMARTAPGQRFLGFISTPGKKGMMRPDIRGDTCNPPTDKENT
jgi:UDP-N-acetylglucosamine acyltransferase